MFNAMELILSSCVPPGPPFFCFTMLQSQDLDPQVSRVVYLHFSSLYVLLIDRTVVIMLFPSLTSYKHF